MVLDIIDYIGDNILAQNPYIDSFGANCIKINDQVVNFVGSEKENFGPSDIKGIGSYARLDPTITYTKQTNKFTSCAPKTLASIGFRLVVFQVNAIENKLHPVRLESKITADLFKINWKGYLGLEQNIELDVTSSNLDFSANFREEVGKDYSVGADAVIIAINCTLNWVQTAETCECPPENSLVRNQVTIQDQNGQVVAQVMCGGTYTVPSSTPSFSQITGDPTDNEALAQALDDKLNVSSLATPTSGVIGYVPNKYIVRLAAAHNLTSQTAAQSLFNKSIPLPIGVYRFTCHFFLSNMSTTIGNSQFSFVGSGGLVTTNFLMHAIGTDTAPLTTPSGYNGSIAVTSAFGTNTQTASAGTQQISFITGTFEVTTAGTITPSVALTTANAAINNIGSYCEIECIGGAGTVTVGPWI